MTHSLERTLRLTGERGGLALASPRGASMGAQIMDFRAQRYRDRIRAEGRSFAMRTARRTRAILDGYVEARRGELTPSSPKILWGRIFLAVAGAAAGVYLVFHNLR